MQALLRSIVVCCALALPLPSHADIYAFIDDDGNVHLASAQVDSRYFLYRKQVEVPQPPVQEPAQPATPASTDLSEVKAGKQYAALITQVAKEHDVDAALVHAIVAAESGFNPRARSPKGAGGLMQLMPGTATQYGVSDVWNPLENLRGGVRYLKDLLALFKDNVTLALAAYNAGQGAVINAGNRIPPYPETINYVPRVLRFYEKARATSAAR